MSSSGLAALVAPAPAAARRGGGVAGGFARTKDGKRHHHQTVCRAHRGRSSRPVARDDDLVTPQGRYPGAWATDLATIFDWDDVLVASGVSTSGGGGEAGGGGGGGGGGEGGAAASAAASTAASRVLLPPKRIALDGANIAWSLGTSIRSRFKCRQFPLSAGVVLALEHEPWRRQGFDVVAFMPKEYVIGNLQQLADGGGRATLNADKVKYVGKGVWVNTELMDLVDAGKIRTVSRGAGTEGRKSDDLTIIEYAKETGSWICSNDQFRDHRRNRALGFSGARDLKAFARMRRFEHAFRVAPGLDEGLLRAMRDATAWEPRVGVDFATCQDRSPVPPPKFQKKKKKTQTPPGGSGNGSRGRGRGGADARGRLDEDAMGSMMDAMMGMDGGVEGGVSSSRDEAAAAERADDDDETDETDDDDEADSGRPTRNDNVNALNGVQPYYAMPQEVLPVYFEPTPTPAMIAAKKSFMNRQGWAMATIGGSTE